MEQQQQAQMEQRLFLEQPEVQIQRIQERKEREQLQLPELVILEQQEREQPVLLQQPILGDRWHRLVLFAPRVKNLKKERLWKEHVSRRNVGYIY
jgi:hypothetical protein